MARVATVESRLGAIEATLKRADEDRSEMNRKMDNLDAKFDAVVAANGETAGAVRQLTQRIESGTRTMEKLSSDDCGTRLKAIEKWAESIDGRIKGIEDREVRLVDCERGIAEFRRLRKGLWSGVWQLVMAAIGGGGIVKLVDYFMHR